MGGNVCSILSNALSLLHIIAHDVLLKLERNKKFIYIHTLLLLPFTIHDPYISIQAAFPSLLYPLTMFYVFLLFILTFLLRSLSILIQIY